MFFLAEDEKKRMKRIINLLCWHCYVVGEKLLCDSGLLYESISVKIIYL